MLSSPASPTTGLQELELTVGISFIFHFRIAGIARTNFRQALPSHFEVTYPAYVFSQDGQDHESCFSHSNPTSVLDSTPLLSKFGVLNIKPPPGYESCGEPEHFRFT